MTNTTAPTAGTRFTRTDARPYKIDGVRHYHHVTTLNEVTATTARGFDYVVVEVLSEENRPPFAGVPTGGSMALFGWEAAVARGDVKVVS